MSLDEKFIPVRTTIYQVVENIFRKMAGFFGFPENPGMFSIPDLTAEEYAKVEMRFGSTLPYHRTYFPPIPRPETWFEMWFGPTPKLDLITRHIYESPDEGYYNFYVENYKNLYLMPDWLSEFLQIRLNLCLDITNIELFREFLFIGLMLYWQMIVLRIAVAWYIYINPYTNPWAFLVTAVDWTEDVFQGMLPSILGVNVSSSVFLGFIGAFADNLNHLVFTMPFLPSEGVASKIVLNGQVKNIIVFHYLPKLWYKYTIPNNIREFWYFERPDILDYMQNAYKDLDIQFLPDIVLKNLVDSPLLGQTHNISNSISTEILSNETLLHSSIFLKSLILHFVL